MRDVFDVDDLVISESTTAEDVEEWDSLSLRHSLDCGHRTDLDLKFKNSRSGHFKNVGDLLKLIQSKAG